MYTFVKYRQYLRILKDGSFLCLISIDSLGRENKTTFLEVTDGNRIFIQISPGEVSGAVTIEDINDAITTALTA